jgi:hypothetical protein
MDLNLNMIAVTGQSFVDAVVHDFIHKVMQPFRGNVSDVHGRTLANGAEPLKDRDLLGVVLILRNAVARIGI